MTYHDHHFHPIGYARLLNGLELMGATDMNELLGLVAGHAAADPGPVIGQRLNDEGLTEQRLPTRVDLDDAVSDRPVLLYRYCGHIAVANTAALRLAGIDGDTVSPDGGTIDKDRNGAPNGILRETAVSLVAKALDPHVDSPSDDAVLAALHGLPEIGLGSITGIVATSNPLWCGVGNELVTLCRLAQRLPIDILAYVAAATPHELADAARTISESDGRVRFGGWKGWSDGSLGGHTAALYQPYEDEPDETGAIRLDPAHAIEMGKVSLDHGGGVAIHAIGDRANDMVLDIHEELIEGGADPARLRIEHASLLTEPAIERMARLRVTASVQPAFLASEASWLERRLGDTRMERVYAFRSMAEAGIPLLGGSDTPVETPDPMIGIEAAVDRHGINSKEALTRERAEGLFEAPTS